MLPAFLCKTMSFIVEVTARIEWVVNGLLTIEFKLINEAIP
jgi:hypothetical protein